MKTNRKWGAGILLTVSATLLLGLMMLPATGQEETPGGPEGPGLVLGDINQDGFVDLLDCAPFEQLLVHQNCAFQPEADIDQDGQVTLLDFCQFVEILVGG